MERYNDEMKLWLFDLAHGNLSDKAIIAGFLKHYVLWDCTIGDVKRDIIFHTNYGKKGLRNSNKYTYEGHKRTIKTKGKYRSYFQFII